MTTEPTLPGMDEMGTDLLDRRDTGRNKPGELTYYAVPDPNDPGQMTYWRRSPNGTLKEWPGGVTYGPVLYRRDVPPGLIQRAEWVEDWHARNDRPWRAAVRKAIAENPFECALRFAELQTRCCCCGRALTDATSKVYGIGPECRKAWPANALAKMAAAVGRMHAAQVAS